MKSNWRGLKYKRVGNMTYEVMMAGETIGLIWRSRSADGQPAWSAKSPAGRVVIEDYTGSRDTAAAALFSGPDDGPPGRSGGVE